VLACILQRVYLSLEATEPNMPNVPRRSRSSRRRLGACSDRKDQARIGRVPWRVPEPRVQLIAALSIYQ
jgi:hypothetical protein